MESEKLLEKKLRERVKAAGGWALKFLPDFIAGLPDRICLMPGGRVFFAEVKTTGEKPTKIQKAVHRKLDSLGFAVYVLDNSETLNQIIRDYESTRF